ncbi:hypothetical protein BSKO_00649 [Bryopsis sp. KO-2023]|nr:hypothetical protein BSKO_00649 [Bryopsis sp. KO-2023]
MACCGFKRALVVCVQMDGEAGCRPANRQSLDGARPLRASLDSPRSSASLAGQVKSPRTPPQISARERADVNMNNAMKLPWRAKEWTIPVKPSPPPTPPVTPSTDSSKSVFRLYNFSKKIGSGTYGTVYSASENASGRHVAIKEVGVCRSGGKTNRALHEAKIMEALRDCSSVVCLREFIQERSKTGQAYIVMDYCGGGDLHEFVKENGVLSEKQAGVVAFEVLNLLRSCHEKRILHGDVKAANFVINSEIQQQIFRHGPTRLLRPGWLKGVDFGTCQQLGYGCVSQRVGTPTHWAPEVFGGRYRTEADMWSLGVMIYQLMAGRNPYFTAEEEASMRNSNEILKAIARREPDFSFGPWLDCSPEGIDFIKGLLMNDTQIRMTACEGLQHPWIKMHQTWRQKERPFLRGSPVELKAFIPCFT